MTCLDLELPHGSAADKENCDDLLDSITEEDKAFNDGNADVTEADIDNCGATRREKIKDVIAQSYKDGDVNGRMMTKKRCLLLPTINGTQTTTQLNTWQADKFDKMVKNTSIKLTKHICAAEEIDIDVDSTKYDSFSHWLHGEIPITEFTDKTFTSPTKAAPASAKTKKDKALSKKNARARSGRS